MPETHSFDYQTQLQTSKISSFPHATQSKQFSFDEHEFSDDFEDFNNKNKIKFIRINFIFFIIKNFNH